MTRRLVALTTAALALLVGACSASNGAETPPNTSISGLGVLPSQVPLDGAAAAPVDSIATSILVTEGRTPPVITDTRVFMEGDSVLRGMAIGDPDPIDLFIGSLGWDITVDAQNGRFTDVGVSNLIRRADEVGQVVVAMLGNNYDGDEVAFADQLFEMLRAFPDVREFVMFTVPLYREDRTEVNDVLRGLAVVDPRVVLIDWEWMSREIPGALSDDRLHPTSYGATLLAQAVGITLGKAPGAGPDVTLPTFGSTGRPSLPAGTDTNKGETRNDNAAGATTTAVRRTTTTAAPSATTAAGPTTTRVATTTTKPGSTVATTATTVVSSTTAASTTAPSTSVAPTTVATTATSTATTPAPTTAATTAPPGT